MHAAFQFIISVYAAVLRLLWTRARPALPSRAGCLLALLLGCVWLGLVVSVEQQPCQTLQEVLGRSNCILALELDSSGAAFSPDGRLLAVSHFSGEVSIWQLDSGEPLHRWPTAHENWALGVTFSPDGRLLASWGRDGTLHLWRVQDGSLWRSIDLGRGGEWHSVAFSPDGRLLAAGLSIHQQEMVAEVRLWRVEDGALLRTLPDQFGEVLAFSADGQQIAAASSLGNLGVWRVEDDALLLEQALPPEQGVILAFAPDVRQVVSVESSIFATDYTVRLWRSADLQLISTMQRQGDVVEQAALSPDGRLLALAVGRSRAHLWRVEDGVWLGRYGFRVNRRPVDYTAFSPDGQYLVAVSNGSVSVWRVAGLAAPDE
jgi:WD40 repeat protein